MWIELKGGNWIDFSKVREMHIEYLGEDYADPYVLHYVMYENEEDNPRDRFKSEAKAKSQIVFWIQRKDEHYSQPTLLRSIESTLDDIREAIQS